MNRQVILILFLILAVAMVVKLAEIFQSSVVESDASKFVLEDLRTKYPGAEVEIMTITDRYNDAGQRYFELKAKVTTDPLSMCPDRSHIFYNYPVQNFVPQPPQVITSNCQVCTEKLCTIAFPEEAIIASHTRPGTGVVAAYLRSNTDASPEVTEKSDSWVVKWDSSAAPSYYLVEIHRNGTALKVEKTDK